MLTELLIFFISLLCLYYFFFKRKPKLYPPGPFSYPLLGNLPQLGIKSFETLKNWKSTYGPVVRVDMGGIRAVAISDVKLIKEALSDPNFAGRGYMPGAYEARGNKLRGLLPSNGEDWLQQRRFSLRHLRDHGLGRSSIENLINDEVKECIENLRENHLNTPYNTQNKFNSAVLNSLWTMLYGERFSQKDPQLEEIIEVLAITMKKNTFRQIFLLHKWITKYFPKLSGLDQIIEDFLPLIVFIENKIKEHKTGYLQNQPRDYIDSYFDEINKTKDPNSSFYKEEGEKQIVFTILDLFIAGMETTSGMICWTLFYLSQFPEVQNKLQNEIKNVVGDSRLPSLKDKENMPYTEAVIHETLRFSSLVYLSVSRSTLKDVHFHSYFIPKDTMIIPNLWAVHFDEEIWGDPRNFRPERFLSKDEKTFIKNDNLLAFGSGKRVCLGESLARDELFLFTTGIFQNFKIELDPSIPKPSLEPQVAAFVLFPPEHRLILTDLNKP